MPLVSIPLPAVTTTPSAIHRAHQQESRPTTALVSLVCQQSNPPLPIDRSYVVVTTSPTSEKGLSSVTTRCPIRETHGWKSSIEFSVVRSFRDVAGRSALDEEVRGTSRHVADSKQLPLRRDN